VERLTLAALHQLLDIFELPRGTGEEGHKVPHLHITSDVLPPL